MLQVSVKVKPVDDPVLGLVVIRVVGMSITLRQLPAPAFPEIMTFSNQTVVYFDFQMFICRFTKRIPLEFVVLFNKEDYGTLFKIEYKLNVDVTSSLQCIKI